MSPDTDGILLFAHGARDPNWARPFDEVAARLRALAPQTAVELAFLEFMSPTLAEAGDRLAACGCQRVSVVPLFLGAGGHVRRDLPELLDTLAARHPGVTWQLRAAVGETEEVVAAMACSALRLASG
ncbi:sirohydrochlorin chelatase [Caldimonas brevitalea]|uniref:Cobalamin biosynthesis protein CbiX n=1 Tax=Caldimonas brevitalea TaxID=413882 RepID=A0A0G3BTI0_9BURK|nr:CbiX/SirB N-terminal domain-containing protein [Caldimonas brevitalea]AKJ29800.1 cobalamin biosynthesis protein CbiX [Caldimonas brevitalea]